MRALLAGGFDDAARRAREAAGLGASVEPRTAQMHFGTQMWVLHRELGKLGELEDAVRGFVAAYPAVPAWRCGLAWVLLVQDRRDEAERVFAEFAAARFANIPRDAIWSMCGRGKWSGAPASYAYRWTVDGKRKAGAVRRKLRVGRKLRGHSIRCAVTATNAAGSTTALSRARRG